MLVLTPANRASGNYVPVEQLSFLVPTHRPVSGLGLELEPNALALGLGCLVLGVFLFGLGAGPKYEAAKRKRRTGQIKKLREQIAALERAD